MSMVNFSLSYQPVTPSPFLYAGPNAGSTAVNNLRLNAVLPPAPAPNYGGREPFHNEPYIPPARHHHQQQQQQQQQTQQQRPRQRNQDLYVDPSSFSAGHDSRYVNYQQDIRRTQPRQQQQQQQQQIRPTSSSPAAAQQLYQEQTHDDRQQQQQQQPEGYPEQPNGYTRVSGGGGPGTKTSVHAILDYDNDFDDYYDDEEDDEQGVPRDANVTPIQGPIFLKNGSVPVVPLYSYPQINNGTFVQIPILWTALSVALGVELRGDLVRGTPCIKRYHQLFCPTAGNTYPIERIEQFIDENKALMKRMYGDFEMSPKYGSSKNTDHRTRRRRRRSEETTKHDLPDGGARFKDNDDQFAPEMEADGESFFGPDRIRNTRQSFRNSRKSETGRVDACESKVEIVTPYWASNSAGKIRAIVNTQHFEQAIHQEVCSKSQTNRCSGDCGCEQKYKWHRLLAYDPDNDCKGIFMDWFLFPSCCVCRCDPLTGSAGNFPPMTSRN